MSDEVGRIPFEDEDEAFSAGDEGDVTVSPEEEEELFLLECAKWAVAVAKEEEGLS